MNKNNPCLIFFVLSGLMFSGCFSGSSIQTGRMSSGRNLAAQLSANIPGTFGADWVRHTINLVPEVEDFNPGQGRGSGMSMLVSARATFMDSALINCGLRAFEQLAEMSREDKIRYERAYKEKNKTDAYYLIWLELQTSSTETLLDLDKWNIFWENDQGQKYEPAETVEVPPETDQSRILPNAGEQHPDQNKFGQWQTSTRRFILFFPRKNLMGEDIINKSTKTITIVLFDWKHRGIKNKGTWQLQKLTEKGC